MIDNTKRFECNRQTLLNAVYDVVDEKHYVMENVNSREGVIHIRDGREYMKVMIESTSVGKSMTLRIISTHDNETSQSKIQQIFKGIENLLGGGTA